MLFWKKETQLDRIKNKHEKAMRKDTGFLVLEHPYTNTGFMKSLQQKSLRTGKQRIRSHSRSLICSFERMSEMEVPGRITGFIRLKRQLPIPEMHLLQNAFCTPE